MRLAGLTWWRNNYGSILQAYALQQTLNEMPDVEYEILNQFGKKITSADNVLDKIKTIGVWKTAQRVFWKFGFKKLRTRSNRIQSFVDSKLKVSSQQYNEETIVQTNNIYDGFICGSDQIWNPTMTKVDSMYWLGFADSTKIKISYAPSIGVNSLSSEQIAAIRQNLSSFKAISCREEDGTQLINSIIGNGCVTVLDPTLMVDKKVWNELCAPRKYVEPYIFVYLLRGTKEQRQMIERFARGKEMKIVTIPFLETGYTVWYDMKFGDIKYWDATPDEFISAIRYAEYVFTDSFHSMVFSCIYHTPFFTFPKLGKAQLNRITGLQKLLKIDSRMVKCYEEIENVNLKKIDWDRVDDILNVEKATSKKFLHNAIMNDS